MTADLQTQLAQSEAVSSFRTEDGVSQSLMEKRWRVTQGAIYLDSSEKKLREIDVLAHKLWRTKAKEPRTVYVTLAVECKTMRGYHIVFNGDADSHLGFQSVGLAHWAGFTHTEEDRALRDLLRERGYNRQQVVQVLKRFDSAMFPGGVLARMRGLMLQPPPSPQAFTAFRETNIGTVKEIDNSVLWRAVTCLDSCTSALRTHRRHSFLDDIHVDIDAHEKEGEHKVQALLSTFKHYARFAWLYHPVVVTDARLWRLEADGLTELRAARYVRSDGFQAVKKWFDVVQREHFPEYISALSGYYDKEFRRRRAYMDTQS